MHRCSNLLEDEMAHGCCRTIVNNREDSSLYCHSRVQYKLLKYYFVRREPKLIIIILPEAVQLVDTLALCKVLISARRENGLVVSVRINVCASHSIL